MDNVVRMQFYLREYAKFSLAEVEEMTVPELKERWALYEAFLKSKENAQ